MTTALFVDTFTRQILVHTVSVTEVPGHGLVLRYGAEIGPLHRITKEHELKNGVLPILVTTRGYSAQSSYGFVEVITQGNHSKVPVIGLQGMPWQNGGSLSIVKPMEVVVLRPGTNLMNVPTHRSRSAHHSNPATASAAHAGLKLRASVEPNALFILEGQSDYVQAWKLVAYYTAYENPWFPKWEEEHRSDLFSDQLFSMVYASTGTRDPFKLMWRVMLGTVGVSNDNHYVSLLLKHNVGISMIEAQWQAFTAGASSALEFLKDQGYTVACNIKGGTLRVNITSPEGVSRAFSVEKSVETESWDLSPQLVEKRLLDIADTPAAEKEALNQEFRTVCFDRQLKRKLLESEWSDPETQTVWKLLPAWVHHDPWSFSVNPGLATFEGPNIYDATFEVVGDSFLPKPEFKEMLYRADSVILVGYSPSGEIRVVSGYHWNDAGYWQAESVPQQANEEIARLVKP
jgi:hypothetical protein